jgi:hypothetical protein
MTSAQTMDPEIEFVLLLSDPVLSPAGLERLREIVHGVYDWHRVLGILAVHRTAGVAWRNLMDLGFETVDAIRTGFLVSGLELTFAAQRLYAIDQLDRTTELMAAFDAEDVDCVLLKGAAVSRMGYRQTGMRFFGDNDILFRRADLAKVGRVMRGFGYQQGLWDAGSATVRPANRREIMLHSVHAHETFPYVQAYPQGRIATNHEVDVHFSIDLLTSNNTDDAVDSILSRRIRVTDDAGRLIWTPHQEDMFAFVGVHYEREASHISEVYRTRDLMLYKLVDLLALMESSVVPLDLDGAVRRARELGLDRELYFSLQHLDTVYPGRVPEEALADLRPDATDYVDQVRDNTGPLHTWKAPLLERFFDARRQLELADVVAAWTAVR